MSTNRSYSQASAQIKSLFCLEPRSEEIHSTKYLEKNAACIQKLNPCDGNHNVVLPDKFSCNGMIIWIINSTIGSGTLYVYSSDGTSLLATLSSNDICHCLCIDDEWGIYTPIGDQGAAFNPNNYYTKTEVDNLITSLQNNLQNQIDNLQNEINTNIRYV